MPEPLTTTAPETAAAPTERDESRAIVGNPAALEDEYTAEPYTPITGVVEALYDPILDGSPSEIIPKSKGKLAYRLPLGVSSGGMDGLDISESEFIAFCREHGANEERAKAAFDVARGKANAVPVEAPAPKAAAWPTETYSEVHRRTGCNIVQFLEEHYATLIAAGQVTRVKLRSHDPSADMAVNNYLRGGRQFPKELQIPTKKDLNDALLSQQQEGLLREAQRLGSAAQRRMAALRS